MSGYNTWGVSWNASWGVSWGSGTAVVTGYGGWPRGREKFPSNIDPRSKKKYDRPVIASDPAPVVALPERITSPAIAENIALIKVLRAELLLAHDIEERNDLRRKIEAARKAKEREFARLARLDDDEAFFLLH